MKIAVLSDIHGNIPALEAVVDHIDAWQPDQVVVNGDIVNRGPCSLDCLQFTLQKQEADGWRLVRGNHEDFLLGCADPSLPRVGPAFEMIRFAHWARRQLGPQLASLADIPESYVWQAPDASELRVVHGSMRGNRDGVYANATQQELQDQMQPAPAVFIAGHTHRPFLRRVNGNFVANVGSVGAPFDENPAASYGRFVWTRADGWQAEIVRVPYERVRTERDYVSSGFLQEAGPLAQLMLVELRKARGLIFRWATRYQDAVLADEITVRDSVVELLLEPDNRPFLGSPGWEL